MNIEIKVSEYKGWFWVIPDYDAERAVACQEYDLLEVVEGMMRNEILL